MNLLDKFRPLLLLGCLFFLIPFTSTGQNKVTLSGYIKDADNGEGLIGASVYVVELATGASSNLYGYYSLNLNPGKYSFRYSYIGYMDTTIIINLGNALVLDVYLIPTGKWLKEAEVRSVKKNENVSSVEMGTVKLSMSTIEKIPALLGEVDLVRSVQLLPGVTTVGEGATGFNVRGGGIDQNLILLDEAPVFNSSHLFGFFSVFNPDAVKDVKLTKGGIPSVYGGRLSSILDVRMKEGNTKRIQGTGGVGAIFSRFALEGPIVKDKSSFIVAGRRSYVDVLAKPFLSGRIGDSRFYFYDLTAKANVSLNKNNKLYVSGYFGRDVFSIPDLFGFDWGNQTVTLRLNSIVNRRLFSNTTAYFSKYDYQLRFGGDEDGFQWKSNIINYSIKQEFNYYIKPKLTLNFGGQSTFYTFIPGSTAIKQANLPDIVNSLDNKFGLESALYVDLEQEVTSKLKLRYGLRYSRFVYMGKGTAYYFNDTTPNVRKTLAGTETYDRFEAIERFQYPEPRISLNYTINSFSSLKASYNRMSQFLHLISNTTASVPLDVWTPSTNNIPGQLADQFALGYFRNLSDNRYETSVEVFYKDFKNQVDYIDGADLLLNEFLEADLLVGKGRSYGAEFFVRKTEGALTGWVSYTLSRSERQVDGINNGEWFPVRFDRTHNLNVVGMYNINEKWSFSGNFLFYTGTPATFYSEKHLFQGIAVPNNQSDSRNNFRIPPYHRMDLSLTYEKNPRQLGKKRKKDGTLSDKKRTWESNWVFSVYNVYARRNPFSIYFQPNAGNSLANEAVRFAVLGAAVPAVTYNFKF